MRARPRRGALGLRGRIVGLVLFTTVATLGVAALALLGPLESRLRNSALATLKHELHSPSSAESPFKHRVDLSSLPSRDVRTDLAEQQQSLGNRVQATVTLLGYPDYSSGRGRLQLPLPSPLFPPAIWEPSLAAHDPYDDAAAAFRTHRARYTFGTINGIDYARVALPFQTTTTLTTPRGPVKGTLYWVLAVRKRIDEIPSAVSAVQTAFLTAALAGLGLTLILGIPLSATLVRRLRRLRQAALRLAREGPAGTARVPVDRARDEVGDLARTFATMQRQLQHQEEARRAFVATASHELRTPLASLDGMLELLDDDLRSGEPDLEEARALLERARAQSRRLARLAGDLLDLSRLDAEVKLRSEPVELGELSRAVLAEFELGTAERGVSCKLEIPGGQVWALGDPGSVARILRILLDNAVRVSPQGGEIKVELQNGQSPALSVCDQGPGIALGEREIIFERFQRGRDTTGQAGFGLGLAIGRELAERMRGELVLDESYGPGAKFILRLPVAHAREVPALILG